MQKSVFTEYRRIAPFARGDGVETRLMVGKTIHDEAPFTSGTTLFPPGASAPLHSHNCAEQVTVLEGEAEALINGEIVRLGPLDSTFIPADVPHYFRNCGGDPLLIFWIYAARDVTRTFTETGETVPHMSPGDQV